MEVEAGVRRHLLNQDAVRGLVGGRVFKHRLEESVDQKGLCAIVVKRNGGWATPDPIQTQEYPLLVVEFWADHSRNADGTFDRRDAEDRAWGMYRAVDPLLHARRGDRWGIFGSNPGLIVVSSARWSEPLLITEDDQHRTSGAAIMGDSVMVRAQYAMQVIHSSPAYPDAGSGALPGSLITGHGAPPAGLIMPAGVEYLDLDTGDVYEARNP